MLKITQPHEPIPVSTIITCIYAAPGLGRTTTCYTADKVLLLDFDQAAHRAKLRKATVLISSWSDVEGITAEDLAPYNTVAIDTVGRALDILTVRVIKDNPKFGSSGVLNRQGWGDLKNRFVSWLKFVRSFGKDIVFAAHMDEQGTGEDAKERLDIQGGSKNEIYKLADLMGRIYMDDGQRMLNFSPTDTAFGKNPAQLPPLEVPGLDKAEGFLGGVIAKTKEALNAMSAEQAEVAGLLDAWAVQVAAAGVPVDFTALLPKGKELDPRIRENAKRVLLSAATAKGFVFDKTAGAFALVVNPSEVGQEAPKGDGVSATEPSAPAGQQSTAPDPETEVKRLSVHDTSPEAPGGVATPLEMAAKGKGRKKAAEAVERTPEAQERIPGEEG